MGARRIGLIGVDFTENHFYAPTGEHPLTPQLGSIDGHFVKMAEAASVRGVEIFNLSRRSRLTAFPKISVGDFLTRGRKEAKAQSYL
jgi:hypothetical protein